MAMWCGGRRRWWGMASCDVCIGGDDYDFMIHDIEFVVLESDKRCEECRVVIQAGSMAQQSNWAEGADYEEEPELRYTCSECAEIRTAFSCGSTEPFGNLWELLEENFSDLTMAGECWDELTAPAKAKLLDRWRKWKGLTHAR